MAVDYFWVYQPLVAMITPPGEPRPSGFVWYHNASKHINEAHLTLALVAALIACWPARPRSPQ
jgi:hypothetical protein